jgi:hypothetical protein
LVDPWKVLIHDLICERRYCLERRVSVKDHHDFLYWRFSVFLITIINYPAVKPELNNLDVGKRGKRPGRG